MFHHQRIWSKTQRSNGLLGLFPCLLLLMLPFSLLSCTSTIVLSMIKRSKASAWQGSWGGSRLSLWERILFLVPLLTRNCSLSFFFLPHPFRFLVLFWFVDEFWWDFVCSLCRCFLDYYFGNLYIEDNMEWIMVTWCVDFIDLWLIKCSVVKLTLVMI